MTFRNFIPEAWAADFQQTFDNSTVYGMNFNRNYQGELKNVGDVVTITTPGRPTRRTYSGRPLATPERVVDTGQKFACDQEGYFNFTVRDIDDYLTIRDGEEMAELGRQMAIEEALAVDKYLSGVLKAAQPSANLIGGSSGTQITTSNAYDLLVDVETKFKENNIPTMTGDVYIALPPFYCGVLHKDRHFSGYATSEGMDVAMGKPFGKFSNLMLLETNEVPKTGSVYNIQAWYKPRATLAHVIHTPETYRDHDDFADVMRQLTVYGAKDTAAKSLVQLNATK